MDLGHSRQRRGPAVSFKAAGLVVFLLSVSDALNPPSVSVSPSGEIVQGSSVNLTCSSDANPAAKYTWYKEDGNLRPLSEEPQLVFSSIQSYNSGRYYCTAQNELGTSTSESISINVKHAPWQISVSGPSGEIVEGRSVTLTCSSDGDPPPTLTWYKENQTLHHGEEGIYHFISWHKEDQILHRGQDGIYHFTSIRSEDSGFYYCKSENQYGEMKSQRRFIDVQYAPKLPSVSVSPSAEIVEGSSVNLTCSSDANPAANYTWYKKDHTIFQGLEGNYYFKSISSEDRGIYYCMSKNQYGQNRSSLSVDVQYAPKLPSVSVSPSAEIVEGSSVTLTCSSDANPAANYTWYKEDEDSPKASGQIFTISNFTAEHSGNYYCEAQNTRGRHNSTSQLTVVADKSTMIITIISLTLVVMLILLLLFCLWIRKKKTLSSTTELNEPKETPELVRIKSAAETEDTKEEEELV
ncbi:B-cell receptor CD22-like [Epinephelus moara]|uniref:B-cell receptor CD22-like n=1 Tax=Epinephelus moara TaxID=300413 RepID=UPI00214EABD8|nr:B-cell receptor CD22-like [Epinephelus moara]